jgi:hypothetical protein
MTDRNDTASFTINVTLPSDVIKTYFDGLAKVEAAKAKPSSSSFNWSNLIPLVPLVLPLLQNLSPQNSTKSKAAKKTSGTAESSSLPRGPVGPFSPGEEGTGPTGPPNVESAPAAEAPSEKSALPESVLGDMASGIGDIITEKEAAKDIANTVLGAASDAVEVFSSVVNQSDMSENTSQRVNNAFSTVMQTNSSTAAPPSLNDMLGQAGGLEGMFKQFAPMLESLSAAFGPPKQASPESSSSTPESSSSNSESSSSTPESSSSNSESSSSGSSSSTSKSSSSAPAQVSTPKKEVQSEEANKEANEETIPALSSELSPKGEVN